MQGCLTSRSTSISRLRACGYSREREKEKDGGKVWERRNATCIQKKRTEGTRMDRSHGWRPKQTTMMHGCLTGHVERENWERTHKETETEEIGNSYSRSLSLFFSYFLRKITVGGILKGVTQHSIYQCSGDCIALPRQEQPTNDTDGHVPSNPKTMPMKHQTLWLIQHYYYH